MKYGVNGENFKTFPTKQAAVKFACAKTGWQEKGTYLLENRGREWSAVLYPRYYSSRELREEYRAGVQICAV